MMNLKIHWRKHACSALLVALMLTLSVTGVVCAMEADGNSLSYAPAVGNSSAGGAAVVSAETAKPLSATTRSSGDVFAVGSATFSTWAEASAYAQSDGANNPIVLLQNYTLTEDITIPQGETLLLPYAADALSPQGSATEGNHAYAYAAYTEIVDYTDANVAQPVSAPGDSYTYLTLKLADGVDITVEGELALGGTIAARWSGGGFAGQTGGAHSDIAFLGEGSITVKGSSARMTSVGFVYNADENGDGVKEGKGKVVVNNGSIYQPFIITDFQGGSYTSAVWGSTAKKVMPFNSYAFMNVQSDLQLVYGTNSTTKLYGYCDLPTGYTAYGPLVISNDQHNICTSLWFGNEHETSGNYYHGLFVGHDGSTITLSYDESLETCKGVGKTTVTMDGNVTMGSSYLKLKISSLYTAEVHTYDGVIPIPYNMDIHVVSGTLTIPVKAKLMPGAVMTVDPGAALHIASGGSLAVYDGFNAATQAIVLTSYPTCEQLVAAGLSERAHLYVQGKLQIDGSFGGLIETLDDGSAKETSKIPQIITGSAANLQLTGNDNKEGGMTAQKAENIVACPHDTKTTRDLYAWVYNGKAMVQLETGKTYYGDSGNTTKSGYTFYYYTANGEVEGAKAAATTVAYKGTLAQTVTGSWVTGYTAYFYSDAPYTDTTLVPSTVTASVPNGTITVQVAASDSPAQAGYKPGYTFMGWALTSDPTVVVLTDAQVASGTTVSVGRDDLVYVAVWKANQYTISFDEKGGSEVTDITADYNSVLSGSLPTPTKDGYTLDGWYTKNGNGGDWGEQVTELPATMPLNGVTYYAKWSVEQYSISFIENGGTEVDDIEQDYATAIADSRLPDISREGYTFDGWYTKDGTGGDWGEKATALPATMPLNGATYYAKWTPKQYTITFEEKGGSEVEDITAAYGAAISKPADPTKEGYTFAGWYADEGYETAVTIPETMPLNGATYYAKWVIKTYKVTFDPNGGNWDGNTANQESALELGAAITKPADPTREGYNFLGWSPAVDATVSAKDVTYTAQWEAIQYTIYFEENGGSIVPNVSAGYESELSGGWPNTTKKGYTFVGWYEDAACTKLAPFPATMPLNGATYYAKWSINQYTITFDENGGSEVDDITKDYAAAISEGLPETTKEGYTFLGWYDANEVKVTSLPETMPLDGAAYKAKWSANRYTITFDTAGGSQIADITADYGAAINKPADPTKEGYTFAGWYADESCETAVTIPETMPLNGATYYAKWSANSYKVTFDPNGGNWSGSAADQESTLEYGASITKPADPTREGYTFLGWSPAVDATVPAKDVTYVAQWEANGYVVTFDPNMGTCDVADLTAYFGKEYGELPVPVRAGYGFLGWYTKNGTEDGNWGDRIQASDLVTVASNHTLTARWEAGTVNFTVQFWGQNLALNGYDKFANAEKIKSGTADSALNWQDFVESFIGFAVDETLSGTKNENLVINGDGSTVVNIYYTREKYQVSWVEHDTTYTDEYLFEAPINIRTDPSREGYTFAGWDTEIPATMPANNLTITAKWSINQYTITFVDGVGNLVDELTQDYGTAVAAPAVPVRDGYNFAGWDQTVPATMPAEDITITAKWTAKQYTIRFDTAGGSEVADITADYGAAITAPADPTKEGYTFAGWYADQACTVSTSVPATMPLNGAIYYAKWTPKQYTIQFNTDGGSGVSNITADYGAAVTAPADPTKEGYTFAGWYADQACTEPANIPVTMPLNGAAYYAKWTVNRYTIRFDTAGGSEVADITADYGAAITAPANPTKEGHTFAGWYDANGNKVSIPATMPLNGATYYAKWTAQKYWVKFNPNGGNWSGSTAIQMAKLEYGTTIVAPENPTREGYNFVGWSPAVDATVPAKDVIYVAQWKLKTYTVNFMPGGSDVIGTNYQQVFNRNETKALLANQFTKTGYTFIGWTTVENGTSVIYTDCQKVSNLAEEGNVFLYPVWKANTYTVTWVADGVTIKTETVEYGAIITAPSDPEKTGYRFAGWDGYTTGATMGAADATYTAMWNINQYTITFADGAGNVVDQRTQNYGTAVTAPADPVRAGYRFDGWDKQIPGTMPAENITITAKWTSYLALLVDCEIPAAEDVLSSDTAAAAAAREKLNLARAYFMQLNDEQKALYATETPAVGADGLEKTTTYKAHQDALFATIKVVATEDQVQNVLQQVPGTNALFAGADGELGTADDIANLVVDTENKTLTIWIKDRDHLALDIIGINFLTTLFESEEIYGFDFQQLHDSVVTDVTMPYVGKDQFTLMTYIAYATINEKDLTGGGTRADGNKTYAEFIEWLASGTLPDGTLVQECLTIGVLDGKPVTATILAKTPEGVEYSVTYEMVFQNRTHDVYWNADGVVTDQEFEYGDQIIDTIAPTKEGYTFTGWKDDAAQLWLVEADTNKLYYMDGANKVYATMELADQTYTAQWEVNQYTITFDTDGGTVVDAITQNYGETVFAPAAPTKPGYTFAGWDKVIPTTMPAENITIKALWTANQYTITFETDGGSSVKDITADFGTTISKPADPTKEGYTFAGWYTDEGCTVPATIPATMPVDGATYYTKWTINQYTITFVDTDGKVLATITEDYNTSITAPKAPTKEGYTFVGWDQTIPATMPAKDLTITAKWTANQYTITFDEDGGSSVKDITADFGSAITTPAAPTKEGYTFVGWDQTIPATMPAENLTIKAIWKANVYKVTLQYADGVTADKVIEVTFGQPYGDALPTPERNGYTFIQWVDGAGNAVSKTTLMQTADDTTVLTAQWKVGASYKITYQDYYGWAEGTNVREQFNVEDAFDLPTPVREGYTFKGWVDENGAPITAVVKGTTKDLTVTATWEINIYTVTWINDGVKTEVTYKYGEKITMQAAPSKMGYTFEGWSGYTDGMTMPAKDLEFTAGWRINSYTLTWIVNGQEYPVTYEYGEAVEKRADPTKTGYTFKGWSEAVPATMPAKDLTITAVFQINQYTITFVDTDGAELHKITKDYGAAVAAPADPTKIGHTFAGWDKTVPATMPAGNVTITAKWTVNQYTITFVDGVGHTVSVLTKDYGAAVTEPADPSREGYTFKGWDETVPTTMPAENLTITATWQINEYLVTFKNEDGSNYYAAPFFYGSAIQLPTEPTKEGYTFIGWSGYTAGMTMPAEDLVFTAAWEVNYYDLIYMVDGKEYQRVPIPYSITPSALEAPAKTGYIFSGWSGVPETMPAEDVVVIGSFTAAKYQVALNQNYSAAEDLADITVTFDSPYGAALPTPARVGYTFEGWYLDGEKITADTIVKTAGDHTLVAKWSAKKFTVTLDANGGSLSGANTLTVTYGGTYGTLPVPSRAGYDFAGWFVGNTQISADTTVTATANQTLVAKWNASGNTKYLVQHHLMNLDGKTYALVADATITGKGATGATVTATQNTYAGFVFNASKSQASGVIAADGSLVLNLYYDRQSYTVVWNVAGTQIRETYLHGAALKVPNTARADDLHASYTFKKWDVTLPGTVTENATYTAQYELDYEAVIGNTTYRTLQLALQNAKSGETVSLARNVTVTENLTVPAGVILLVPCVDNDPGYFYRTSAKWPSNHDGVGTNNHIGLGPNAKLYRTLTVAQGVTLTVDGRVLVNSVSGRSGTAGNDQDITGGYGQIDLYGDIVVRKGGVLDCFGYIKGDGAVTAKSGGTVGDLFIVRNWRGGTQGLSMYQENVYPMNEHDCNNIRATLRIESGATLEGLVKMYAQGSYYYTRFPQVDNNNGLVRLDAGAYMIRLVKEVSGELRTIFKIYGGADFASSTMEIVGLDITSADFRYPIDGDMDYELYDGRYDFVNQHKAMPGATITVGTDAQLYVAKGVNLVLYKEFNDPSSIASGIETAYPAGRPAAKLIILDNGTFTNAGTFAGEIYTENHNIFIGAGPVWSITTKEANGYQGDPKVYEISHKLNITHSQGHKWYYGEGDSIVWEGKADYSKVQQAIAAIPDDLSYYTDASIADIKPAVDAVIWDLDADQQSRVNAMAQPILDAIAKLQKKKVTLTLDPVGGTVTPNSFQVDSIGKISEQIAGGKLPTPTKQYHSFQGWYDANGNRVRNSSEYKSSTDFVLYATWKLKDADYTNVKKARADIPEDMSMYSDESVAAVQAAVDAIDWTLTADRQDEVEAMAQAIWDAIDSLELKKVTLILNANGGSVTPGSVQVSYTQTVGNVLPTPVRPGYTFQGWYDANGVQFTANTQVDFTEGVTLTAKWKANRITVTFHANGGSLTGNNSYSADCGTALTKPADPTRTGYTFTGWYQDAACTKPVTFPATMPTADSTYYAGWKAKTYTVTLDPAGGTLPGGNTVTVTYDGTYALPTNVTRAGYTFTGWYLNGQRVQNGDTVKITANTTLKAQWIEGAAYRIDFDLAGGSWQGSAPDAFYKVTTPDFTLPVPVREGYTFLGWTGSNGTTPQKTVTIPTGSVGDKHYTANWKVNVYTVTWVVDGTKTEVAYQYGAAISKPVNPTKTDYIFIGWSAEIPATMPAKNLTFEAKWAIGINKITSEIFTVKNGESISKIKIGTLIQGLLAGINERDYCTVYDQSGKPAASDSLVGTGMTVQLKVDGTLKETVTVIVTGDVNGDGKVTVSDMIQVKAHILETKKLTGAYAAAADVSGDGKLTISDFIQIKAYILGKGSITAR